MQDNKPEQKFELVAFTKEEAKKVQDAIDETLKLHGAEIVITNSVQVFKKVLTEANPEGVPSPAEFLPAENGGSGEAPASN